MRYPLAPIILWLSFVLALTACATNNGIPTTAATEEPIRAVPLGKDDSGTIPSPLSGATKPPTINQTLVTTTTPTPTFEPEFTATPTSVPESTPNSTIVPTRDSLPVAAPSVVSEKQPLDREEDWVLDRINAVVSLYNIKPGGKSALQQLDVRWMRDQPGFFGSFGFKGWTGVGEAKPNSVMHELSHAYWGLFPVTGFLNLSWEVSGGSRISPAIRKYHEDVLEFMKQPPDQFEPLRTRLRNLPELSSNNTEPLFHSIEADAIYTTAGDLNLMPPILRKYWDQFLGPGRFGSWYEALGWYSKLATRQKRMVDKFVGFEHFDLGDYDSLKGPEEARLQNGVEQVLVQEEIQRLHDFVEIFDLLLVANEDKKDFKFWRRYIRDKVELHKQHPELVAGLNLPRSNQISEVLDFLAELGEKADHEKPPLVIQKLGSTPFLVQFLPALDNHTLLTLFTLGEGLPQEATLKGTAEFVDAMEKYSPQISDILKAAHDSLPGGVSELTSYLNKLDFEHKEDVELFFEIFQGSDHSVANEVVAALDDTMLRRLLKAVPAKMRSLITVDRLLEVLDITMDSSSSQLGQGIQNMIKYPSGNFRIDEPYLDGMYRVVAERSRMDPLGMLDIVSISTFPMERFMSLHPEEAVDIFATDLDVTSELVKVSDPTISPPARFVYRLIYADPEFAARVVEQLHHQGEDALVVESLAHFAYDADRLQAVPGLPISLDGDGRFLKRLLESKGRDWLGARIAEVVNIYGERVQMNVVPRDFLEAYKKTMSAAASKIEDTEARSTLAEIISVVVR